MNTNVEQVLTHHLTAFGNNDLDAILKDYTEDSVILTPIGKVAGLKKMWLISCGKVNLSYSKYL